MTSLPPPGWYRDPENSQQLRWWDGQGWAAAVPPYVVQVPQTYQTEQVPQTYQTEQVPQSYQAQQVPQPQQAAQAAEQTAVFRAPGHSAPSGAHHAAPPSGARRVLVGGLLVLGVLAVAGGGVGAVASLDDGTGSGSAAGASGPSSGFGAPVNANASICTAVKPTAGDIEMTFARWNRTTNEFDPNVSHDLRDDATQLTTLGASATAAPAQAIGNELRALNNLSNAIDKKNHAGVSNGVNTANNALAQLRAVCHI